MEKVFNIIFFRALSLETICFCAVNFQFKDCLKALRKVLKYTFMSREEVTEDGGNGELVTGMQADRSTDRQKEKQRETKTYIQCEEDR